MRAGRWGNPHSEGMRGDRRAWHFARLFFSRLEMAEKKEEALAGPLEGTHPANALVASNLSSTKC